MLSGAVLTLYGDKVNVSVASRDLSAGWSMPGYWRETPMAIGTALAGVSDQLVLVKNDDGGVYWPEYGIDGIHNMQPGEGYQFYMNAPAALTYPES